MNSDTPIKALQEWQPIDRETPSARVGVLAQTTRQLVGDANPSKRSHVLAAGYVYQFLRWATEGGELDPSAALLTDDAVDDYLAHLRENGASTGQQNAARSYLRRCVPGSGGLQRRATMAARAETSVENTIRRYSPRRDLIDPARWQSAKDPTRQAVIAARPQTSRRATTLLGITTKYVAYRQHIAGPDAELFDRASVEEFLEVLVGRGRPTRSTKTYASNLRFVARHNRPEEWRPRARPNRSGLTPYSVAELADIEAAIAALPEGTRRRHVEAAYLLAVGAGVVGTEAVGVRPADVIEDLPSAVRVVGLRARTVTPLGSAGPRLQELADAAVQQEDRFLLGGNRTGRADRQAELWRTLASHGTTVNPARLRISYLVRLVELPLPLRAMLAQAGVADPKSLLEAARYARGYDEGRVADAIAHPDS